ncbi:MAG: hypothetical protein QM831_24115 [Kofleriaceae bacterium]
MMRGIATGLALLLTACGAEDNPSTSARSDELGLPQFALVFGLESNANVLSVADTSWTLTKTASVDTTAKTVTWAIQSTKGAVTGSRLVADGYFDVFNLGTAPATIGNIVVNLQTKQGNKWVTVSSDVADATSGDAATSAHVVGDNTVEGQSLFTENSASGALSFTDRRFNTMFSLVPEQKVQPWTDLPLVFSASFNNDVLHVAQNAQVRFEVVVTFGNHPLGGPNHTDENVDINGNGIIDADEHKVKSLIALQTKSVPAQQVGNTSLALSDAVSDIATQGTVTFTNPVISLGTTTGTVKVNYDAGTDGGSITNCAHGTGAPTISTTVGGRFTFIEVPQLLLTTCTTAPIAHPTCTPGAPGCGWKDGDMESYGQNNWGEKDPISGAPATHSAQLLVANYDTVYAATAGIMTLGIPLAQGGKQLRFSNADPSRDGLFVYLPQFNAPAALNANLDDPEVTSAGIYGGQVAALQLNIDFNNAGLLGGTAAVRYQDVRLCGLTGGVAGLNGSTISQLRDVVNTSLGGGSTPYTITDLSSLLTSVCEAFQNKDVSTFAQDHLVNAPACP